MYFCPNCKYTLDIKKSNNLDEKIIITEPKKLFSTIKSVDDFLENVHMYIINIPIHKLEKEKEFIKLNKDLIKAITDNINFNSVKSEAELKCNICSYTKPIVQSMLLYVQKEIDNIEINILTEDEKILMINDPSMPHTNDYNCMNLDCPTHRNSKIKDAIFFKHKGKYSVNYLCTQCLHTWPFIDLNINKN